MANNGNIITNTLGNALNNKLSTPSIYSGFVPKKPLTLPTDRPSLMKSTAVPMPYAPQRSVQPTSTPTSTQPKTGLYASTASPGNSTGLYNSGTTGSPGTTPTQSSNTPAKTEDNSTFLANMRASTPPGVLASQEPKTQSIEYPSLVSSLANQGNSTYNQGIRDSVTGLNGSGTPNAALGANAQRIASEAGQAIRDTGILGANTALGYKSGQLAPIGEGNALAANNAAAQRASAIASGANMELSGNNQALTAQGQTQSGLTSGGNLAATGQSTAQSALGTATGFAKPEGNTAFFGSPITGGVAGAGQGVIGGALNSALQLVKNGTSPQDAFNQSGLGAFGSLGQAAFTQALQGGNTGYNPTTQNAVAGQNASQAVDYQGQATNLDTSLKQLDTISSLATNFLQSEKLLNPTDNPDINAGINTYVGKFKNPASRLQYNAIIGDIKKFTSTILASNNGTIPTDVTNTLNSFDPSTLSAKQLVPYLQTLSQLGSNQLSVLQGQSKNSGGGGYSGTPTSVSTQPILGPQSNSTLGSTINSPYAQAAIGTGINAASGITGLVSGLFSKIFQ